MSTSWDDLGVNYAGDSNSGDSMLSGSSDSGSSSGSSDSGAYDRYGTTTNDDGSYNVPSGYVRSVSSEADEQVQSDQVTDLEDELDGSLDETSVTTSTNDDGTTNLVGESNTGDTVSITSDDTVTPEVEMPDLPDLPTLSLSDLFGLSDLDLSNLSGTAKAAAAGFVALLLALVIGGGS